MMLTPAPAPATEAFRAELGSHPDGSVLVLSGELDLATAADADAALRAAEIRAGGRLVLVDLSGLVFMDVAGLHCLLTAHRRLGDRLRLRACPPPIRRVFALTGTLRRLPLAD
jgi:anti-sigma B factor antagonist